MSLVMAKPDLSRACTSRRNGALNFSEVTIYHTPHTHKVGQFAMANANAISKWAIMVEPTLSHTTCHTRNKSIQSQYTQTSGHLHALHSSQLLSTSRSRATGRERKRGQNMTPRVKGRGGQYERACLSLPAKTLPHPIINQTVNRNCRSCKRANQCARHERTSRTETHQ